MPLGTLVEGPPASARALSQIGLVEDDAGGDERQASLAPGQSLVSRAGAVWRWDGYTIRAGTPTPAAVRLKQRNRLAGLRARLAEAEQVAAAARARAGRGGSRGEGRDRRRADGARGAAGGRAAARTRPRRRGPARAQAATVAARLAGLEEQVARIEAERAEADAAARARARDARQLAGHRGASGRRRANARRALRRPRTRDGRARATRDTLAREHEARTRRRRAIAAEREDWADSRPGCRRAGEGSRRPAGRGGGGARFTEAAPAQIAARRAEAMEALGGGRSRAPPRRRRVGRGREGRNRRDRAARAAEAALAAARENAVRAEGDATQADHAWGVVAERILERLGASPALPNPPADLGPEAEEKARRDSTGSRRSARRWGRSISGRSMEAERGGDSGSSSIAREREELSAAIAKLRGSIGHLNREGRERLGAVFQDVDRAFQALFTRMFGGGRAHLALVGSDDPLEAGLEIYAQPPGKKLATLSLLSGGEQALTALSLIFAVFRCNPAPVCVLDEVDAPLDEANVERFCNLLDDMVRETGTRFLVVTHHHLTMARMDRLYGVTMQERGVSRLLSVDLQVAAGMVEQPRMAAE